MAAGSIRENNITALIARLVALSWITGSNNIKRVRPTLAELENYPDTLLPILVVEADLPVIEEKRPGRSSTEKDTFISVLEVGIFCYFLDNDNPDEKISDYMDDLWNLILSDQSNSSNCFETEIIPSEDASVLHMKPYAAFRLNIQLKYQHTNEGI